jgi:hypothetical protein
MAGYACLATGTVAAACWKTCRTTDDCDAGLQCVAPDKNCGTPIDDTLPRYCVPSNAPPCPGLDGSGAIFDGQHCDHVNADVFAYSFMSNFGCAFEYVHCTGNCTPGFDGWAPGNCPF